MLFLKMFIDLVHGFAHRFAFCIIEESESPQMIRNQIKQPYPDMHRSIRRTIFPKLAQVILQGHGVAAGVDISVSIPPRRFGTVLYFASPVCKGNSDAD